MWVRRRGWRRGFLPCPALVTPLVCTKDAQCEMQLCIDSASVAVSEPPIPSITQYCKLLTNSSWWNLHKFARLTVTCDVKFMAKFITSQPQHQGKPQSCNVLHSLAIVNGCYIYKYINISCDCLDMSSGLWPGPDWVWFPGICDPWLNFWSTVYSTLFDKVTSIYRLSITAAVKSLVVALPAEIGILEIRIQAIRLGSIQHSPPRSGVFTLPWAITSYVAAVIEFARSSNLWNMSETEIAQRKQYEGEAFTRDGAASSLSWVPWQPGSLC